MDDGDWPFSFLLFFVFILLEAAFYGFGEAVRCVNESSLERETEQGSKRAKKLLRIINRPAKFVNTIQIITNVTGMVMGACILRRWSRRLEAAAWQPNISEGPMFGIINMAIVGIVILVCLVSFGIIIPKRCAAKEPEKWAYALLPVVTAVEVPLLPFTWIVTWVSFGVLRLFGVDWSTEDDNVTEEDIMTMVNEGHEQGVLEAKEAEMITNIFELNDKDAETS